MAKKYRKGIKFSEEYSHLCDQFKNLESEEGAHLIDRVIQSVDSKITKFLAEIQQEERDAETQSESSLSSSSTIDLTHCPSTVF